MGVFVNKLNKEILEADKAGYYREQYQSYMTGPEWRNVEMAEEYGEFLQEGKSIFQFPYFRQVYDLWRVIFNSYSAARKYNSSSQILFSEYMLMDLFIGFFTTLELIPKGILSIFIGPFLNKDNKTQMQQHLADYYNEYASNLQTIPFYDHKYKENREKLAQAYSECTDKTWGDWFSWKCVSIELWARRWISKPLSYWFHQDENLVAATTDVLVKINVEGIENHDELKEALREKVANVNAEMLSANINVSIVPDADDDSVYVKAKNKDKSYTSVYARLRAPRYADFQTVVRQLSAQKIELRKIAGQDQIQVKCLIDAKNEEACHSREERLNSVFNAKPLYGYGDRVHNTRKICLFDVPVKDLSEVLTCFDSCGEAVDEENQDVSVKFIHNF
ncbi:hypothetical protein [Legionella hackeliae]|uniref:Uncharacterized protein n=1 Tax=Legionella hackeliae TaxID=449 RepID=A0A0A8UUN8_LEGHA|nr:hypothetical protein [Legionella hackeliae]KTD09872.1 hypothetical protein Lhac_2240 [Legionella hackeliae]CEK10797.1 conserved protein of unknown function [coiled-coil domain] [Legionella hackeliae]STX47534.1 Uncharacterised protein [Legionella hackeliae]